MKVKTIQINFEGSKTINELYKMTISEVKQVVMMSGGTMEELQNIKNELKELVVIIENRQLRKLGYELIRV